MEKRIEETTTYVKALCEVNDYIGLTKEFSTLIRMRDFYRNEIDRVLRTEGMMDTEKFGKVSENYREVTALCDCVRIKLMNSLDIK